MIMIYVRLIQKGLKTLEEVPEGIREKVKQVLVDLNLPELAEEI